MAQDTVQVEQKKHHLSDGFIEERIYGFLVNYPFETKNPDEKKYIAKIKDAVKNETFVIGIDYEDIYSFFQGLNPNEEEDDDARKEVFEYQEAFDEIIKRLNKNPIQITKIFKGAVTQLLRDKFRLPEVEFTIPESNYSVYISGYATDVELSDIDSTYIGKMKKSKGMLLGYEDDVLIKTISSTWKCDNCEQEIEMKGMNSPKECPACQETHFTEDINKQKNIDCLNIILQQPFESRTINNYASMVRKVVRIEGKALVNHFKATVPPGSTVEVTGVITLSPKKVPIGQNAKQYNMARTEIYALYLESKTDDSFDYNDSIQNDVISKVKPAFITNHVKKLLGSVAPHIYGNTVIKLGLLLQLVGAPSTMVEGSRIRGDIHQLLLGDPATGKSEVGRTFLKLIPKSVYVQADAATGVGLTSAVMPPDEMGSRRIELGALPLANGSGVFVEEIDKLKNRDDLNNLSSALDDVQVIVPRKGGFMSELPTRAPCIFAANPHGGADWDQSKSIFDQTKFPTWFFSRMDLIWITRKPKDKAIQEKILQHRTHYIMNSESEEEYNKHRKSSDPFSVAKLNEMKKMIENNDFRGVYNYEYIINELKYLKTHYHPTLPQDPEAFKMIDDFIINAQPMVVQQKDGTVVSYTVVDNRTKNSIIRLALASARLHRREVVAVADIKLAITLVKESIETRKIEAPSLVVGEMGSSGDGMFTNPKVLNNLLKLTDQIAKLENDRYTTIMKALSNRAKAFNKAILKVGTEMCHQCKGMGMTMDMDTRRQTRCGNCNSTGKIGKPFYMSYIEDYLTKELENTPFTSGPKGQIEVQKFAEKYAQMGWIKQKAVDTYEIHGDIVNDISINRGIQNFIRQLTGLLYDKEMNNKLDETKKKTGGSSVGMADIDTADKLR